MKNPIRIKLAKRIKSLRVDLGITQEEFALKVGLDYKYLQRIEGKDPPNIQVDTLDRIAKGLKISPAKLLDFK